MVLHARRVYTNIQLWWMCVLFLVKPFKCATCVVRCTRWLPSLVAVQQYRVISSTHHQLPIVKKKIHVQVFVYISAKCVLGIDDRYIVNKI